MDALPDSLPEEAVQVVMRALEPDPVAASEFVSGLSKAIYRLQVEPGLHSEHELLRFVRGWLVSVALPMDETWRASVNESERRIAAGQLGEPVPADRLRDVLRG